ncbi:potassium-transporting ATPase subunit KdpC [Acuticoccus kandeliae]|uniref:potassium-transporting ATPase subunit KdpC n=1 Tax=Acuticoccus kandeliae TaxID=2073160 RepID=UPI000D3E6312|nr:potassium-transporting ATPase subunit KdpC [Acuticoccus kandeliae]
MSLVRPALTLTILMTALLGLAYPLGMTALSQAILPHQANGSLLERDGVVIGSALIGQPFAAPRYLWPRPSAVDYDAANSAGSNLGPTNAALVAGIAARAAALEAANEVKPPVDLVTASASGLDPHISPEGAFAQAARIATARGVAPAEIRAFLRAHVEGRALGFVGEPVVNVLLANLALDEAFPMAAPPAEAAPARTAATNPDD